MKKTLLILLIICSVKTVYAKNDIQIAPLIPSFFTNLKATIDNIDYTYQEFVSLGDSFWRISNQNYLWNNNYGFYESIAITPPRVQVDINNFFGIKLSVGFAYNIFDNSIINLNNNTGTHISFFKDGIVLGVESDFHIKFLPTKRFSPVIGTIFNFDFYSSLNPVQSVPKKSSITCDDSYQTNGEPLYELKYYYLQKYRHFFVQLYLSFCINF